MRPVKSVESVLTFKSSSSDKVYRVTKFSDGTFWCSCPHFVFQKLPAERRVCKHTANYSEAAIDVLAG